MTFLAALFVFISDRMTKIIAMNCLVQGKPVEVLPAIFRITLVLNTGTAFGLFKGKVWLFSGISVIVIAAILIYSWKRDSALFSTDERKRKMGAVPIIRLALGLILGGACGNLFDRIRFGYVIDFLDFRVWPVFNLADSAITIGVAIIVILGLLRKGQRPFFLF